jgi:hypothetical protein
MGLKAASRLADKFNRTPGDVRTDPTYFNNVRHHKGIFDKAFGRTLDGMSAERKTEVLEELIAGNLTSEEAVAISKVFENFYEYLVDAGLPVKKVEGYFPRVWDSGAVLDGSAGIMTKLKELGLTERQAQYMLDHMAHVGDEATNTSEQFVDPLNGVPYEGFLEHRAAILDDPFFNKFQSRDLDRTIRRYAYSAVKRAEFNRSLGQDARKLKRGEQWDPRGKLREITDEARAEGATQEQLDRMTQSVEVMLGRHGRTLPPNVRSTFAWLATYQHLRLMLFSALSSLPDVVGPAVRTSDFRGAFKSIRDNWKELANSQSEIYEAGRAYGIISDTLNEHMVSEWVDQRWYPEGAKKVNYHFFRLVGLERWTNFTRAAALAVGRDAIKKWAAAGDTKQLEQLGLTTEDVKAWVAGGEKVFGATGFDLSGETSEVDRKVAGALIQVVNESVMNPDPSQRPAWMSNPAFLLLAQFKTFFWAFHNTITRQIIQNLKDADTPWQKAAVIAAPAAMLLAFTALGLELRETLQYKIWGQEPRTRRMTGDEYVMELIERSGIYGPAQIGIDFEGADERGQMPLMAIAGPQIQQLNEWVSRPASQNVPKAIPVISQIPHFRQMMRSYTPLGE